MVTVKFFASFREKVGKPEIKLSTKAGATLENVIEVLEKKIPGLKKLIEEGNAVVALNEEIAAKSAVVKESDEIAIFPPVSGGEDTTLVRCRALVKNERKHDSARKTGMHAIFLAKVRHSCVRFCEASARSATTKPDKRSGFIRIQKEDFLLEEEIKKVKAKSGRIGGVVAFLGTAREFSRGRGIKKLVCEHYPGMAQKKLEQLRKRVLQNFDVLEASIIHRTGEIKISENIVLIIVAAEHRKEAFKACQWCIDELKRVIPIWKKEITNDGEVWVEEHA